MVSVSSLMRNQQINLILKLFTLFEPAGETNPCFTYKHGIQVYKTTIFAFPVTLPLSVIGMKTAM